MDNEANDQQALDNETVIQPPREIHATARRVAETIAALQAERVQEVAYENLTAEPEFDKVHKTFKPGLARRIAAAIQAG